MAISNTSSYPRPNPGESWDQYRARIQALVNSNAIPSGVGYEWETAARNIYNAAVQTGTPSSTTTASPTTTAPSPVSDPDEQAILDAFREAAGWEREKFYADLAWMKERFGVETGLTAQQLTQRKYEFDQELAQRQREWTQQGLPTLEIEQRMQSLREQQFAELRRAAGVSEELAKEDMLLRQRAQAEDTRRWDMEFAESMRRWGADNALQQAQLGLEVVKTAASLGGPENWIQAANYYRGVGGMPQVPVFLQHLANNTAGAMVPWAGTPGAGALPAPQTLGAIQSKLTGGPGVPDVGQQLRTAAGVFANPHKLALGSMENLRDTEMKMFGSLAHAGGVDIPSWMQAYTQSRVGQQAQRAL